MSASGRVSLLAIPPINRFDYCKASSTAVCKCKITVSFEKIHMEISASDVCSALHTPCLAFFHCSQLKVSSARRPKNSPPRPFR